MDLSYPARKYGSPEAKAIPIGKLMLDWKGPLKETLNNQTRLAIGLIGIGIIGPQNCNRCHSTGLQIWEPDI